MSSTIYFKKSMTINGVRFNFGKNGLTSISAGKKGGPRIVSEVNTGKNYIHGMTNSIYYREDLNDKRQKKTKTKIVQEESVLDLSDTKDEENLIAAYLLVDSVSNGRLKTPFNMNDGSWYGSQFAGVKESDWITPFESGLI